MSATTIEAYFANFVLILLRVSMLFVASPVFGRKNVPNMAKILLAVTLTNILINVVTFDKLPETINLVQYVMMCFMEMLVGLSYGLTTMIAFSLSQSTGQLIDIQLGLSMSSIYDPQTNAQTPITATLLNMVLIAVFFAVDGHHRVIAMLVQNFEVLPLGGYTLNVAVAWSVVDVFANAFFLGIQVAMPILVTSLLVEVVLGIIVRNVPQMNMFVVGIPLKILVGLVLMIVTVPIYVNTMGAIFEMLYRGLDTVIRQMGS